MALGLKIPDYILNKLDRRNVSQITCVFIHHSVADPTIDISDIAIMEEHSQGFLTVGYNAYCKLANKEKDEWIIQQGRPIGKIPAAQYGMNTEGYAICIAGNYEPGGASFLNEVSKNALDVVAHQIHLVREHAPNVKYLLGHRDVAKVMQHRGKAPGDYSTACCGTNLYKRLDDLRKMTGLQRHPEV